MSVAAVRELLRGQNPFVLGKYPNRLAPAHILNGFVSAAFGSAQRANQVRDFIVSGEGAAYIPFLGRGEWPSDVEKQETLRADLSLIFDADQRAWENFGSLSVVVPELAGGGPNDDGFGRYMWDLVDQNGPADFRERLRELLTCADARDPITATANLLVEGTSAAKTSKQNLLKDTWYGARANASGRHLAKCLAEFLYNLAKPWSDARRLQQIQHLARGLQVASVLAQILGAIACNRVGAIGSVAQIAPLLAWGGVPPGNANDPIIQDCQKSYFRAIGMVRRHLIDSLTAEFASVKVESSVPREYRRQEAILTALQKAGMKRDAAEKAMKRMSEERVVTEGSTVPDKTWCTAVVGSAYGQTNLPFGLRIMGRKVGLVGPERGAGRPRMMCDTPLLGTLVIGLLGQKSSEFREFVDLCRNKLGLVYGIGTNEKLVKDLGLWSQPSRGRNNLLHNQESFRRRLIRAGLAREYSDGHTEVMAHG